MNFSLFFFPSNLNKLSCFNRLIHFTSTIILLSFIDNLIIKILVSISLTCKEINFILELIKNLLLKKWIKI